MELRGKQNLYFYMFVLLQLKHNMLRCEIILCRAIEQLLLFVFTISYLHGALIAVFKEE